MAGLTRLGTVQIDHMNPPRPRFNKRSGYGNRISRINRRLVIIALKKSNAMAVSQINRWEEFH
jgi:hypothetical protein